ncbi:hypothetical protein [Mycobacterium sp. 141]|uniref:hypothetical protein n=1 Tax=Mycobacterium sp. 141 TaxID=1120797 RepID=UPI0003707C25|nr:hypothetical protein [Mycobacterium sp. 141]
MTVTDHLTTRLIYEVEKLTWYVRRAHFEGEPDYPELITLPGVEPADDDPGPSWDTVTSIDDIMPPQVRNMLKGA